MKMVVVPAFFTFYVEDNSPTRIKSAKDACNYVVDHYNASKEHDGWFDLVVEFSINDDDLLSVTEVKE